MPSRRELANAIRFLAKDAVQKANSGHPGMPMGMADIAEVLWQDYLQHNPSNPHWPNRDRFVLSNGHGSMLQYALLHLTGYDVSIEDIKQFRQLHSKTPGHPEVGDTPGVETTTGPLGQGLANGVGMALAEKMLAAHFNRENHSIVDHHTYVFAGDGCLMEGISHEVCSLAGTWKLGKLVVFYDDNGISIDGNVEPWFTDNVPKRFRAYGWHVVEAIDGHNPEEIKAAIEKAHAETHKPSIICCKTIIGFGSPGLAGTAKIHGSPLSEEESEKTREALKWKHVPFEIPEELYQAWDAKAAGEKRETEWETLFKAYQDAYPDLAKDFKRRLRGDLPREFGEEMDKLFERIAGSQNNMATRKASGEVLAAIAPHVPELIGGSADLTGSNNTDWPGMKPYAADDVDANYLYYGVREFGMATIMNGLALYGGFIPYGGTFLVFQSYCASATRMAALMKQKVVFVFSHDSIGLGEDGPTHQPLMEAATLRMTPNMTVWRPCDMLETIVAWRKALENNEGPTALLLSRQTLPQLERSSSVANQIEKGAYILHDTEHKPSIVLIATGSEVQLALEAAKSLYGKGIFARVVSMLSCEMFLKQDEAYQDSVLPKGVKRIAIEASSSDYWYRFVGLEGCVIGLNQFGMSAPGAQVFEAFGFTADHIIECAEKLVRGK